MKTSDKNKGLFFYAVLAFIIGFVGSFGGVFYVELPKDDGVNVITSGEVSIHFLELGNKYSGDSIYIKAGDNDILIDAGSRANSADVIESYVNNYCTDGVLEYVIATHAHQDHIAGFAGNSSYDSIFEKYECEVIIEFALTNAETRVYDNYCDQRDNEIEQGAVCYTAAECWNEDNDAKRSFDLGEGISLDILYNAFYFETTGDENDYSVCVALTHGSRSFVFTGDLEGEGETKMVEFYENNTQGLSLPENVEVFKAGHHGSKTSSTEALLAVLKPKIVCVCCCCGGYEYTQNNENTFPTQDFINRVAPWTDAVYVTTLAISEFKTGTNEFKDVGFESMNGTIIVTSDTNGVSVVCTNNNLKLKDTDWFKNNRTCPDAWK